MGQLMTLVSPWFVAMAVATVIVAGRLGKRRLLWLLLCVLLSPPGALLLLVVTKDEAGPPGGWEGSP